MNIHIPHTRQNQWLPRLDCPYTPNPVAKTGQTPRRVAAKRTIASCRHPQRACASARTPSYPMVEVYIPLLPPGDRLAARNQRGRARSSQSPATSWVRRLRLTRNEPSGQKLSKPSCNRRPSPLAKPRGTALTSCHTRQGRRCRTTNKVVSAQCRLYLEGPCRASKVSRLKAGYTLPP